MPIASSSTSSPPSEPEVVASVDSIEAPPPFLGTWQNVYLLLLGELAALVIGFWLLTRWAS